MAASLEQRVAALENQVAQLRQEKSSMPAGREWVDDLYGKFAGDPVFVEAMKLGRKYRRSLESPRRKSRAKR